MTSGSSTFNINLDQDNEKLSISAGTSSYTFRVSGAATNSWTLSGSLPTANGVTVSGSSTERILTTANLSLFSTINIFDSASNTSVYFETGSGGAFRDHFLISLDNQSNVVVFNGTNSFNLGNSLALNVDSRVEVASGKSLSMANGDLDMQINMQSPARTLAYSGLMVNNGTIRTTGFGKTNITARGGIGDAASYLNKGIAVISGGKIIGGTAGTMNITGYGYTDVVGTPGGQGVLVSNAGGANTSTISSEGANVSVTGYGANSTNTSASGYHAGVVVGRADGTATTEGGLISSSGNGAVTITGHGGRLSNQPASTGTHAIGVFVAGSNATISSGAAGLVNVTGTAGGAAANTAGGVGVRVLGGSITSGSDGSVLVTGHGNVTSESSDGAGVLVEGISGTIAAGPGTGTTTVNGTAGGCGTSGINPGVKLTGGKITSLGSGNVVVTGRGGQGTGNQNPGVLVSDGGMITAGDGDALITGYGGGSAASDENIGIRVQLGGGITSDGFGNVTVNGFGGNNNGTGSHQYGVYVTSNATDQLPGRISSSGGNVTISGTGGGGDAASTSPSGSSHNIGVFTDRGGYITAGLLGTVTVTGQGGGRSPSANGSNNHGVRVSGANKTSDPAAAVACVSSSGGAVTVIGIGGGGHTNHGVQVSDGGLITSTGDGAAVNVTGTGNGDATNLTATNHGVYVSGCSTFGNLTITSNNGPINIVGTKGPGSMGQDFAACTSLRSVIGDPTNRGNVTIVADSATFDTQSGSGVYASERLIVAPRTAGVAIDLGSASLHPTGPLAISSDELATFRAATIQLGNPSTGNVSLSAGIVVPIASNLTLHSNGSGSTLSPTLGTTPNLTLATGKLLDVSTLPVIATVIDGTTIGSGYTQLKVVGDLSIAGKMLSLTGSHTPAPGESFTIVEATNLTGTFAGLPEGSTVTLNGRPLVINYSSTSVTLNDPSPNITTNPTETTVTAGTTATFTAAASGVPAPTVQWQSSTDGGINWSDVSGATGTTYSFTAAVSDNGNRYRAVFTNTSGTAATTAALLTVNSASVAPAITANPSDATVTAGSTATFTASASGTPTPTVKWQLSTDNGNSWSDIPGATNTTYSFTATAGDDNNRYRAIFSNGIGADAISTAAKLTVQVAPTITTPSATTFVAGVTGSFQIIATGNPAATYSITAGTLPSGLTLNPTTGLLSGKAALGTAGSHALTITANNGVGTPATQPFTLTVLNQISNIQISKGQQQRSYLRYIDLAMANNSVATQLASNAATRMKLIKRDLNGNNPTEVPLTGFVSASGSTVGIDFGWQAIGGHRNTNLADGYYTLQLDLDNDGTHETSYNFFRLFGDTNGDGKVDQTDMNNVMAGMTAYSAEYDLNFDGRVNSTDLIYLKRALNRSLNPTLPLG